MTYPQRSKSKKIFSSKTISAVVFVVVLFLVQYFFSSFLKTSFTYISKPVLYIVDLVESPFSNIGGYFRTKGSLIKENLSLKDSLAELELKEYDYDLLQKENDDLKTQLGRSLPVKKIIANILLKPPQSPYDTFVIDIGSKDGVVLGSKAYISDKIIIGVISEVRNSSSVIELLSTSGKATNATLERTGASYGLVGLGGQNYKLEVPKDTDMAWGDVFVFPGIERSIVGSIYYIDTNSQNAFKTAYIRAPVNTFSYKNVLIDKDI